MCCHSRSELTSFKIKWYHFLNLTLAEILSVVNCTCCTEWHSTWKIWSLWKILEWLARIVMWRTYFSTLKKKKNHFLMLFLILCWVMYRDLPESACGLLDLPHHLGWQTITKVSRLKSAELQEMSPLVVFNRSNYQFCCSGKWAVLPSSEKYQQKIPLCHHFCTVETMGNIKLKYMS